LEECPDPPLDDRRPCPTCRSTDRRLSYEVADAVLAIDTVRTTVFGATANVTVRAQPGTSSVLPMEDRPLVPTVERRFLLYPPTEGDPHSKWLAEVLDGDKLIGRAMAVNEEDVYLDVARYMLGGNS
ncbi:MAG: hypothetical protein M3O70_07605, partial [Actinomycetota bacterium]|nr:hypothetical protein [Actinomycetota bacterium]